MKVRFLMAAALTVFSGCAQPELIKPEWAVRMESANGGIEMEVRPIRASIALNDRFILCKYAIRNETDKDITIFRNTTRYYAWDGTPIFEFPSVIANQWTIPAGAKRVADGVLDVPIEAIYRLGQTMSDPSNEIALKTEFCYSNDETTNGIVSAIAAFKLEDDLLPLLSVSNVQLKRFEMLIARKYIDKPENRERIERYFGFMDRSYESLSNVLGFAPSDERKIRVIVVDESSMSQMVKRQSEQYIQISWAHIDEPWIWRLFNESGGKEMPLFIFAHELTHYFLFWLMPQSPRWFIEGPASFFGGSVCRQLGIVNSADMEQKRLRKFAVYYRDHGCDFLFKYEWPVRWAMIGSYELGSGISFELMEDIERVGGKDVFRRMFADMQTNAIELAEVKDYRYWNEILIRRLNAQSVSNLVPVFEKYGYEKESVGRD